MTDINTTVELIADPVITTPGVPNGMAINPVFDWSPIAGIPLWFIIGIVLVFGCILVWFYWIRRVGIFRGVAGWKESAMKATQNDIQTWIISRTQKLTIECMYVRDNILSSHDPQNISMFHINSGAGIIRVGSIPGVVISEDFDQNRDFITETALVYNCDAFNHNQEQLKKDLKQRYERDKIAANQQGIQIAKPHVVQPIADAESYEEFGRSCLEHINPDGLSFPSYSMFDPQKFRKYFPRGCSGMFFGGELLHDARKLNLRKKQKGFWEVHAFLAGAIGIGMIALLVAWLFPMG
jgi:hypothetical protein